MSREFARHMSPYVNIPWFTSCSAPQYSTAGVGTFYYTKSIYTLWFPGGWGVFLTYKISQTLNLSRDLVILCPLSDLCLLMEMSQLDQRLLSQMVFGWSHVDVTVWLFLKPMLSTCMAILNESVNVFAHFFQEKFLSNK